jgi:hypothetical protein
VLAGNLETATADEFAQIVREQFIGVQVARAEGREDLAEEPVPTSDGNKEVRRGRP